MSSIKRLKTVVSLFLILLYILIIPSQAFAKMVSGYSNEVILYDKSIAKGINYSEKQVYDILNGKKNRLNIITADLNDKDVGLIFSKAKDKEKKVNVLTKQIEREIYKGNNVVAGINADMFNMVTGFSTGPQIREGAIIAGHSSKGEEGIYPVFGIDNDNKAFIDNIYLNGKISASGNSTSIDNVNRESFKNSLVIITNQLNENKKLDFKDYAANGALTIIKGIKAPIKLGQEYEGVVESLGIGSKNAVIPDDGIIIASNGEKTNWVKSNLKPGTRVRISVNYSRPNIKEVVGAYTYIVKDGNALSTQDMVKNGASQSIVGARKARTAIGITEDNRVIAITADGGNASRGISDGVTVSEVGLLMKDMGAVCAVALDGGGSTQMNVRLYGENSLRIVNKPSDGAQRALTNGILFVSNAPRTNRVGGIIVERDITIFKGSSYQFKIKGADTNINPGDFSNVEPLWSVSKELGNIDSNGLFKAGQIPIEGEVTATSQGVSGRANINVIDTLGFLGLDGEETISIDSGGRKQFQLNAQSMDGAPVIISSNAAQWSVTGNIGEIDKNGLLTVKASSGSGEVIAKIGDKAASVKVFIQQSSMIIDGFEHNDSKRYKIDGSIGGTGSITSSKAKGGKYSYMISYNYDSSWDRKNNGTINVIPTLADKNGNDISESYMTYIRPKKLGMWVYGDGKAPWLRAVLKDGESDTRTIDLASRVDWTGWKYVEASIPQDLPLPISLNYLYFAETSKNLHNNGSIYIDDINFIYTDSQDLKAPYFSNFNPASTVYGRDVNISTLILDDKSGVNPKSIKAKLDGKLVAASYNTSTKMLTYSAKGLSEGNHTFEVEASDNSGNISNPPLKRNIQISLKEDSLAPEIKDVTPVDWYITESTLPRISARIKDNQSGVDFKSLSIALNGNKLTPHYDAASGWVYAIPESPISKGEYNAVISVKDMAGNITTAETTFMVEPIEGPKDSNKYTFSVLTDTHAADIGYEIFDAVNKDESELVIHNGDIIDEDEQSQWNNAINQMSYIKDKYVVLTPGNQDMINGSLESYMATFGVASPTYSFEYGNSLFISLNSSYGQSISASDPTQFDYLKRLLSMNKKVNIFIYTYTPTKDTFGTKHEMPKSDALMLENILSDYKKANPEKNINVIFGNLHTSQSWEVSGVKYTIAGNGCLKRYIRPENGGFLSYTRFEVDGSRVTKRVIPIVESISVIDTGIIGGEMKLTKGMSKELYVYGDFSTLNADYIIPLNNFKDIKINWKSDNPNAVAVSNDGVITAKGLGKARITVEVLEKKYSFNVTSISQDEIKPFKIGIAPEKLEVSKGSTTKLKTYAYNLYGESYLLDNSDVKYEVTPNIGSISGDVFKAVSVVNENLSGKITAAYKDIKVTIPVRILKPQKYAVSQVKALNIRDNPSISSNVVGTLRAGEKLELIDDMGEWLKVRYNEKECYIAKEYVKIIQY